MNTPRRLTKAQAISALLLVADRIDNLVAALGLPLPDSLHVKALRDALPDVARQAREAVRR